MRLSKQFGHFSCAFYLSTPKLARTGAMDGLIASLIHSVKEDKMEQHEVFPERNQALRPVPEAVSRPVEKGSPPRPTFPVSNSPAHSIIRFLLLVLRGRHR